MTKTRPRSVVALLGVLLVGLLSACSAAPSRQEAQGGPVTSAAAPATGATLTEPASLPGQPADATTATAPIPDQASTPIEVRARLRLSDFPTGWTQPILSSGKDSERTLYDPPPFVACLGLDYEDPDIVGIDYYFDPVGWPTAAGLVYGAALVTPDESRLMSAWAEATADDLYACLKTKFIEMQRGSGWFFEPAKGGRMSFPTAGLPGVSYRLVFPVQDAETTEQWVMDVVYLRAETAIVVVVFIGVDAPVALDTEERVMASVASRLAS